MSNITKSILKTAGGLHNAGIMSDETHDKFKEYDSHSIKVLSESEADKFPWHLIQTLADKYVKPIEAVERGVTACHLSGADVSYYEERYLKGNKEIPENETYTNVYKEMLLDMRDKSWITK